MPAGRDEFDGARQLMEQLRQRLGAVAVRRRQQRRNRLHQADEPTLWWEERPTAGAAQFAFTVSLNKVMFPASGNRRSCNAGRSIRQGGQHDDHQV